MGALVHSDDAAMELALAEARRCLQWDDVPVGAVVVRGTEVVASAGNERERRGDPTAHAVMVTLRDAASRLGTTSLRGVTIFCVQEPCVMCVGALLACDVDGLVYAVPDRIGGAAGGAVQVADAASLPRRLTVVSGILGADALEFIAGATPVGGPARVARAAH